MAMKSTIFKVCLQVTDMDRHHYQDYQLTIARHPSENDERMMVRVLAFALHASERLSFTKGLSSENEPDIWQKNLSDEIELWIDLGQADEKRIRRACGRSKKVAIYTYQQGSATAWWQQQKHKLERFNNLSVIHFSDASVKSLAALAQRAMHLQCTIQDGSLWLSNGADAVEITPNIWKQGVV